MNKREIKVAVIIILFILVSVFLLLYLKKNSEENAIKRVDVSIENKKILAISESEKEKCIEELIKYLNKEYYYECKKIIFYNNKESIENNSKYFYALVVGGDKSLIEITNLGNSKFEFSYIGNETNPESTSKKTGVSYKKIVNYKEYKKDKELEKMREEAEHAPSDATEMP